ncbi:MAG: T9SS type A sorting domain-containing protein [Bacteroidota bacterium]
MKNKRFIFSASIFILAIMLLSAGPVKAQKSGIASVSMDTIYAVPGTLILMPVIFDGWNQPGVNAISLDMHIADTNVIGYRGLQDFCSTIPSFNSGNTNYVNNTQHIYVSWSSLTSSTAVSDTLIKIKLLYKGGTSAIEFIDENCEIADYDGISYTTTWNNGLVSTSTNIHQPKATSEKALMVFPNPADDKVFFSFQKSQNTQISVSLFNQMGELVLPKNANQPSTIVNKIALDVKPLPEGFYYYIAETGTNGNTSKMTGKIVVKH